MITQQDIDSVKAYRKASREQEIALHGKQCSLRKNVYKLKKQYNRKEGKGIPTEYCKAVCF